MILKKPYAFLIKYFRVIHLMLALLLGVFIYKLSDVLTFYNNYIANGYTTTVNLGLSHMYLPPIIYLILIFIIVLSTGILVLLMHKEKPYKLYLFIIIYYLLLFVGIFYLKGVFDSFETELLSATTARAIRDILIVSYIPQIVFIVFIGIRAIGFNIKKFNFQNDIKELSSGAADSEEFEFNVNVQGYKITRSFRRFLRENSYYLKENKFIVFCIIVLLSIIGVVLLFVNSNAKYDQNIMLGKSFTYNKLLYTFDDNIITNMDYRGEDLGQYYVVVKAKVNNNTGNGAHIDYNNFKLIVNDQIINPETNKSKLFIDYVSSDLLTTIPTNTNKEIALIYSIKDSQINDSMYIQINNGSVYVKNEYINKHINIRLKNNIINSILNKGIYTINTPVNIENTFLTNTNITILNYSISNNYLYEYEICKNNICDKKKDYLVIDPKQQFHDSKLLIVNLDFSSSNSILKLFANSFISIEYSLDGTNFIKSSIPYTPDNANDFIAFILPQEIEQAVAINLNICIRNIKYVIKLKS